MSEPKLGGEGILYPSFTDSNEILRFFSLWLNHTAITDRPMTYRLPNGTVITTTERRAFELLLERLENTPIYFGLPFRMKQLDLMSQKLEHPTRAALKESDDIAKMEEELVREKENLHDLSDRIRKIETEISQSDVEGLEKRREEAERQSKLGKARYAELRSENRAKLKKMKKIINSLLKDSYRAEAMHGADSAEYAEAKATYKESKREYGELKSNMAVEEERVKQGPLVKFEEKYGPLMKTVHDLEERRDKLSKEIAKVSSRINDRYEDIRQVRAQYETSVETIRSVRGAKFDEGWVEGFTAFCGCMRYDQRLINMFTDLSLVNRTTFMQDFKDAYHQVYKSSMIKSQGELGRDAADRNDLRLACEAEGSTLHISTLALEPSRTRTMSEQAERVSRERGISAQALIDRLLDAAEATVNTFSELPMFDLLTQIDLTRRSASYHELDETGRIVGYKAVRGRRIIPRIGYFQFRLDAADAYRAYEEYLTQFKPITEYMRSRMIDALVELSHAFNEHSAHIKSVNAVTKTVMYGDQILHSYEAISIEIMMDTIKVAIDQLEKEEPDIDNYVKAYMDENVPGYAGGDIDDLRCQFYNPFSIAPVYYIFGIAGTSHKAVDKIYLWLHIVNTECDDMDCIPSALSVKRTDLVRVLDSQIGEVREKIAAMSAQELDDSDKAYQAILSPVTVPWIIIKNITQCGQWKVFKCSSSELAEMTPMEFKEQMNKVVGLHVKQGHMTRIIGFNDYDGAGWEYSLEGFLVIAKVNANSGVGNSLIKLLRGNSHLLDFDSYCIGEQTYAKLVELGKKQKSINLLRLLVSRELIPALVHDSLEMAETMGMALGPGEINGKVYDDSVPVDHLMEDDCVAQAYAEWDQRYNKGVVDDDAFKVWNMLRLPRWIIVSHINKEDETWLVDEASDDSLLACTPEQAIAMSRNLVVFVRRSVKENKRCVSVLSRAIDYFIKVPSSDGSMDQYSGRYNFVIMCNENGILETIKSNVPKNEDEEPLITPEEFDEASQHDTIEEQLSCFKGIRYVLINDVKLTRSGRIKFYESVVRHGKVKANDIADGAPNLLRLWMDPNKQTWLIVGSRWYNIQHCLRSLYDELPVAYIGADYETVNAGSCTIPSLLSWARMNGTSEEVTTGCFKGTQCTRRFVDMLATIVVKERRKVIVITFHGAFFDMHMLLEGIATWGNFGQHNGDRVIVVGNKLLEIDWLQMIKFIDLRRFTQGTLAGICEAFHVKNPKSDIDLRLVQRIFETCNCSIESFWIALQSRPSTDLVQNIEADRQCPEFQQRLVGMDGEQAYIAYCINDSVATVQCYMKLKQACVDAMQSVNVDDSVKAELKEKYNIDLYCTVPSMAYKCYRSGLPVEDGERVKPPVASNLEVHKCIKASGVGGRSEIYNFAPPYMIQEYHQVYDVVSLFPFAAMAGHMPAGEMHVVMQKGNPEDIKYGCYDPALLEPEYADLPIPNKLGIYYCTIDKQPELVVIPNKEAGHSLDWRCTRPFDRWVHVIMIRLHIYLGGKITLHHGYVWDGMNDQYFNNSLRLWKDIKNGQDILKKKVPTISREDLSIDMDKFEAQLNSRAPSVDWAFINGVRDEAKIKEVLKNYNPMVRWLAKMMSVSLLGRTAKKLKDFETLIINGSAPIEKFIETHAKDKFVIHRLSRSQDPSPSAMTQLMVPYSKCSMVSLEIDQNELFDPIKSRGKDCTKIPEACISVTMFAYTHFHMALALLRFYKARALRGVETDGIHANPEEYIKWCEANGISNPFWIDSPLLNIEPGSILDDAVFKPTPNDARSEAEMTRLGAFYCPAAAKRYAERHKLPEVTVATDYGHYTEEITEQGLFDVFYPFCKFYYFKSLATGEEVMKAKGLSASKKSPSREGHDYIMLEHSTRFRELQRPSTNKEEVLRGQIQRRDMIYECLGRSQPVVSRALFEKIGQGIGVDAIDYRFQGRLSKINATQIHTEDLVDGKQDVSSAIRYTLLTKRIEPHRAYRVTYSNGRYYQGDVEILPDELELIKEKIREILKADDPIGKRGFTMILRSRPAYISNHVFRKLLKA